MQIIKTHFVPFFIRWLILIIFLWFLIILVFFRIVFRLWLFLLLLFFLWFILLIFLIWSFGLFFCFFYPGPSFIHKFNSALNLLFFQLINSWFMIFLYHSAVLKFFLIQWRIWLHLTKSRSTHWLYLLIKLGFETHIKWLIDYFPLLVFRSKFFISLSMRLNLLQRNGSHYLP